MTRRILSLFLFLFFTQTIFAQKVLRQEHVTGSWTMVAFNMAGIYLDFDKDSIELSTEIRSQIDASKLDAVKADIKKRLEPYKEGHLKIDANNKYSQTLMGETATGSYSLITKDDKQYLRIVNDNKDKDIDDLMIWKDKGWLHISYDDEESGVVILIFERRVDVK